MADRTKYWSLTSKKRLKTLQTNNDQSCNEYIIQFPAFFDTLGHELMSLIYDFILVIINIYIC